MHDVAHQIVDWAGQHHPALDFDCEAVLFGAATHDLGKTVYSSELSAAGSAHEEAGRAHLLSHGVSPRLARFAGTHASWTAPDITVEDLLVSLADKIWKNKRVRELEDLVVTQLVVASGGSAWEEFMALDDLLGRIGDGADERLEFQASYPVHG
ncbi:phosphohydrolase [Kitasatospora sp. NPDC058218]|uniref:phosphohydrolase n=1 Tax=Kitasatospora sp. NPDC058218 TaxID=3346385 RepID=UPI0036DABB88